MKKLLKKITSVGVATATLLASSAGVASAEPINVSSSYFFTDIGQLINRILTLVMALGALLVFMYLIWGGIDWITSGGDKGKTETARNKITAAVIGLIVLAAAYAILSIVLGFLNAGSLNEVLQGAGIV